MSWKKTARCFVIMALFSVVSSAPSLASHMTFSYLSNRFELTGPSYGTVADEFDDGVVAPWTVTAGTVHELSSGYMHLTSPGVDMPFPGYPNILLDRSDARAPAIFDVQDGLGNFTVTSEWYPVVPDLPGGFYATMLFVPLGPTTMAAISLAVANTSPALANEAGSATGLHINQSKLLFETDGSAGIYTVIESELFAPGDFTGDIVFQFDFDDATNQITQSFSIDGGATFQSPFTPIQTSMDVAIAPSYWQLMGDPATLIPEPSTALLLGTGILGLAISGRRRISKSG